MEYAFLTTLIPREMEQMVRTLSVNNMQDAANALQWNLLEGLSKNLKEPIRVFNILPIGSFPQYYHKAFVKTERFATESSPDNYNIGFCNIKLLRKYHQPRKIYHALMRWCRTRKEPKTLFVYTASAPFMQAVSRVKKKFPALKVCAIIADLPNMSSLSSKKGVLHKIFTRSQAKKAYSNVNCVDYFVLLTKHMAQYMNIQKPWIVMEGIAGDPSPFTAKEGEKKTILYTGTLHRKFGVLTLIEAFGKIPGDDYRLVICGVGDSEREIKAMAQIDDRICFLGQVTREKALQLQQEATVLVNPRQNNEEFTKYSFPSKTMEYLASGIPVVAYKLDGIPDEYDAYINYAEDNSAETLARKLMQICELDEAIRREIGNRGSRFVLTNKNCEKQTQCILKMVGDF